MDLLVITTAECTYFYTDAFLHVLSTPVYRFGIDDCRTGSATMYIWNETIAGWGTNEIVS